MSLIPVCTVPDRNVKPYHRTVGLHMFHLRERGLQCDTKAISGITTSSKAISCLS